MLNLSSGWGKNLVAYILFPAAVLCCLLPFFSAAYALILGIAFALTLGNPHLQLTRSLTHRLLTFSVMGLGAGMNLLVVAKVGMAGIGYTVIGISSTMLLGWLLGKWLKTGRDVSLLITVGTAICGGSAIAAVAPVLRAKSQEVSVALGTVFLLNAVALICFPPIGHYFQLSENQFGLWSALAIHDTSSVVGATMQYGPQALAVGTTVKLARALWIVPVTLLVSYFIRSEGKTQAKRPWFILGFLAIAAIVTWIPSLQPLGHQVEWLAKRMLVLTLFLIGSNLSRETIRSVGARPFLQGFILWILVMTGTLGAILAQWIRI